MSNPNERSSDPIVLSDSRVDVVFEYFCKDDPAANGSPFYDRLSVLGLASGQHLLRAGSIGADREALIEDYPANIYKTDGSERHLREAIVMFSMLVHHYIFDVENDQVVLLEGQLGYDDKGRIKTNEDTIAFFQAPIENPMVVKRHYGSDFEKRLNNRLRVMELLSDDAAKTKFIRDTDCFVNDCRLRIKPTVQNIQINC